MFINSNRLRELRAARQWSQEQLAKCPRRLRDAGLNPWWQLISLAPVGGIIVLLYFLTYPTITAEPTDSTTEKASH